MKPFSRRNFLKTAALAPFILKDCSAKAKLLQPSLAFSTLGCPDWTFPAILDFAVQHGYTGIELRGIQRELDLMKRPEFDTPEHVKITKQLVASKGLKVVNLGASAALHHSEPKLRQQNLDQAKRYIDLASALECPFIRVFPNDLPKTSERSKVIDLIINGLVTLGDYAKKNNVVVLMETHGDVVETKELKQIMEAAATTHAGLIWDVVNMWAVTKQPPAQVYGELKKYIRHVHLKDLSIVDGKAHYVRFSTGEAPVFEAIDALRKGGYKGYYSFEWEKLWHPEIEEPEVALAEYSAKMKSYLSKR